MILKNKTYSVNHPPWIRRCILFNFPGVKTNQLPKSLVSLFKRLGC